MVGQIQFSGGSPGHSKTVGQAPSSLGLSYAVTRILAETDSLDEAAPRLLQTIGEQLNWQLVEFWSVGSGDALLHRRYHWTAPELPSRGDEMERRSFARGDGLPGRVWVTGKPVWTHSLIKEGEAPRNRSPQLLGMHSVMAFPVRTYREFLGVLTVFTTRIEQPARQLLEQMDMLGLQIGSFIQRTHTNASLAASEQRLRQQSMLLQAERDAAVDGILLVCCNHDNWVVDCNQRFLEMWHLDAVDIATRSDQHLLHKAAQLCSDPEGFLAGVQRYYDDLEATGHDELQLRDGRTFDRYTAPVRDLEGAVRGRGWYFRDITEKKKIERSLFESEQHLRFSLHAANAGAWQWHVPSGRVQWSDNLHAIHGLAPGVFNGTIESVVSAVHPEDRETVKNAFYQTLEQGTEFRVQYRTLRPDEKLQWVEGVGRVERDEQGRPLRLLGICMDITARKIAELEAAWERDQARRRTDQLEHLTRELVETEQRERRRLAQLLHDELQQLLVAVKFQISGAMVRTDAPQLRKSLQQIKTLSDQAIAASRSLTAQLSPQVLRADGLAAAIEALSQWMQQHYNLAIHMEGGAHASIKREPARTILFDCVRELLLNVAKHAGVGEAWVHLDEDPHRFHVNIEDRGKGFDANQLDPSSTASFGLSSVRERLEWIGGELAIDSSPGQGTRIHLDVPKEALTENATP